MQPCIIDFFNLPMPAGRRNFSEADRLWSIDAGTKPIVEDGL
jgi:hypothetical protein